jgi:hypothetical protein
VLSVGSQLAWVKLLCYMKRDGVSGRVKSLAPFVAAKKWSIGVEDVEKLIQAAIAHGALVSDEGIWVLTAWDEHQGSDPTNAERQARFRGKKHVTPSNAVTPLRNVTPVTICHATETETETREIPPNPQGGGGIDFLELLPESHRTVEVRTAWNEFETMRKETGRRPWKDQARKSNAAKFAKFSPNVLAEAFRTSVQHQWQGVFPERIRVLKPASAPPLKVVTAEELREAAQ